MSTKLTKALQFSNILSTINNNKAILLAKTETLLSYSVNGGTFTIDRELLGFIHTCMGLKQIVLLDDNKNPILIKDIPAFYEEIRSRYFEAVNDYHAGYEKLRKERKIHKILDLNQDGE